ncbi:MAG: fused MFS/spermidine synthase [Bryobacteraceae bacterium]
MNRRWFFAFFFVSGFCSLVYEVVWLRLAMARFGVTTPLVSIVLSVFMAGLGLGSWAGGIFMRRFGRSPAAAPLRLYGLIELLIGVSGLVVPVAIRVGYNLLRDTGKDLTWGSSVYYLASGAWVGVSLLPWCACMGATFPLAMAAMRAMRRDESQHSFSFLYLANVLGAVLGTLVPAFILIELFGFQGTLHIAVALNVMLALTVWLLSLRLPRAAAEPTATPIASAVSTSLPRAEGKRILWLLFSTGLCSMAMEVIWTRQFTAYLSNLVYAFATILALYLLATFLGSSVYRLWGRKRDPRQNATLWILLTPVGLFPLLCADPRFFLGDDPYTKMGFVLGAIRTGLGVGLFSGLVGFLTPMLVDQWSGGVPDRAGRAYAVNVVGSIVGPLLAGFLILPWAGEHWGLCLTALPLVAIGLATAWSHRAAPLFRLAPRPLFAVTLAVALLLAVATREYEIKFPERMVLRDYTATVIATGTGLDKRLLVNGVGMTLLTPITKIMAHLPLAMLPHPPSNALVICFGMGTTFRSMLTWDVNTTAVELIPSVPKLYGYFHADGPELLKSPLAHVVIDDGRRFLERSPERYDVITVDPPPPISTATSSLLYSQEFYATIKPHLRPGSILQVWFPGGDDATLAAVARAMRDSFPYTRAYQSIEGWGIHFFASMEPFTASRFDDLPQKLPPRAAADLVEWNPGSTPKAMLDDVLGRGLSLEGLIAPQPEVPALADDRPTNEYFLLRCRLCRKVLGRTE